jgi:hypothetical protein
VRQTAAHGLPDIGYAMGGEEMVQASWDRPTAGRVDSESMFPFPFPCASLINRGGALLEFLNLNPVVSTNLQPKTNIHHSDIAPTTYLAS